MTSVDSAECEKAATTRQRQPSVQTIPSSSAEPSGWRTHRRDLALRLKAGLLRSDSPDQHTEHSLGHDVSHAVSDLLIHRRHRPGQPDVLNDIHKRISQPANRGEVASRGDEPDNALGLAGSGLTQAGQQGIHHIEERDHGQRPPDPADSQVVLDLTRVPQGHHHRARQAQLRAHGSGLTGRQLHDQDQLDQQQWHGQQPINVTVGVVERGAGHLHVVRTVVLLHFESPNPRVEDSEIVVRRNPGHNTSDRQRGSVAPGYIGQLQPEENSGGAHRRNAERQNIVHRAPLTVGEIVW
eukprot:CAMPEP_0204315236 /NCGR_PEP_ID=MMETSP0469-20131031/4694_1 /ASSEMBLY_ACC=CAM_ASM_000384 /TAXON_ID=2969 /ORGANISM="Oxyrrhis marina" /LENGTH=295 /DNA_ID=CAMNT_0051295847 /DNA_START=7 /DNA_END=891 /DNA_ORIENTATION=+